MKGIISLFQKAIGAWFADKADRQAAALAYYGVLSLAPLLVIAITVAGIFFGQADVQQQVVTEAEQLLGTGSAELVNNILNQTYNTDGGVFATITSLIILLFAATNMFFQLKTSLNRILNVEDDEPDKLIHGIINFLKDRLLAALMVVGVGLVILLSQILSTTISVVISLASGLPVNAALLLRVLNFIASIGFSTVVISLILRFLPDKRLAWRDLWVGGLFTAVLFALGQRALSYYFETGSVASAYGVAGSLVVILLWIYFASSVLLFGAEFTQAYAEMYGSLEEEQHHLN